MWIGSPSSSLAPFIPVIEHLQEAACLESADGTLAVVNEAWLALFGAAGRLSPLQEGPGAAAWAPALVGIRGSRGAVGARDRATDDARREFARDARHHRRAHARMGSLADRDRRQRARAPVAVQGRDAPAQAGGVGATGAAPEHRRAAGRRDRARLQQPADGRRRLLRPARHAVRQRRPPTLRPARDSQRGDSCVIAHASVAGLQPAPDHAARGRRRRPDDRRDAEDAVAADGRTGQGRHQRSRRADGGVCRSRPDRAGDLQPRGQRPRRDARRRDARRRRPSRAAGQRPGPHARHAQRPGGHGDRLGHRHGHG